MKTAKSQATMATQSIKFTQGTIGKLPFSRSGTDRYAHKRKGIFPNLYLGVGANTKIWRLVKFAHSKTKSKTLDKWPVMNLLKAAHAAYEMAERIANGMRAYRRNARMPHFVVRSGGAKQCVHCLSQSKRMMGLQGLKSVLIQSRLKLWKSNAKSPAIGQRGNGVDRDTTFGAYASKFESNDWFKFATRLVSSFGIEDDWARRIA